MTNQNANPQVPQQGRRIVMQTFDVTTEVNTTVMPSGQPVVQNMPYAQQPVYPQQGFAQQPFYPQGYGPGQPFFGQPYFAQYPQGVAVPPQAQPQFVPSYGQNGQILGYVPVQMAAQQTPAVVAAPAAAPAAAAAPTAAPAAAAAPAATPPVAAAPVTPPVTPPQNWWQRNWKKLIGWVIAGIVLLLFIPFLIKGYGKWYNDAFVTNQQHDANNQVQQSMLATLQALQAAQAAQAAQPQVTPQAPIIPEGDDQTGGGVPTVIPVVVGVNCFERATLIGAPVGSNVCKAPVSGAPAAPVQAGSHVGFGTITFDAETRVWILENFIVPSTFASYSYDYTGREQNVLDAPFVTGGQLSPVNQQPFNICWDTTSNGCVPPTVIEFFQ